MNETQTDQILISGLRARGCIGVPEKEREQAQDLMINLVLYVNLRRCAESDNVTDSVDYAEVTKQVLRLVETNCRHTVEALAGDISVLCLSFAGVERVRVRVEKPNKVRFTQAVGVEIERSRPAG